MDIAIKAFLIASGHGWLAKANSNQIKQGIPAPGLYTSGNTVYLKGLTPCVRYTLDDSSLYSVREFIRGWTAYITFYPLKDCNEFYEDVSMLLLLLSVVAVRHSVV
eukprot:scaffold125192_cov17-Prasinocladus_malaysianus.AAC.1